MNPPCKGNFDRLLALMDGSLRPKKAERLREHMKGCPGCADAYRRLQATHNLCREAGTGEMPEINWREVETKLHWRMAHQDKERSRVSRPAWRPGLALAGAALAGALLTAAVLFNLDLLTSDPTAPTPVTAPAPVAAALPAPADRLEDLPALATLAQGEVYLLTSSGSKTPLELNRPFFPGDRAITYKGRLAMQWGVATGLRMVPDTEVELKQLSAKDQELVLWQGKIFVEVKKRAADQQLAVLTQGVRVQVKGTHLAVARGSKQIVVEVYRGSVVVQPEDGGWKGIEVPAGFALAADLDGKRKPELARISAGSEGVITAQESESLMNLVEWTGLKNVLGSTGPLKVSSKPAGADLRLNSRLVGTTDLVLRSPYRNHLLEVYRGKKLIQRRWVEYKPGLKMIKLRGMSAKAKLRASQIPEVSAAFSAAVRKNTNRQIQRCYERRLKQNPNIEGILEININVDGEGRVVGTALTDRATVRDAYLVRCAMARAQMWRFAPAKDAKPYDVTIAVKLVSPHK